MLQLTSLIEIGRRLTAALHLVKLAGEIVPQLARDGRTTQENAAIILRQIPALQADIDHQIEATLKSLENIQDRIEALAQFLLLHRTALTPEQLTDLEVNLRELRG